MEAGIRWYVADHDALPLRTPSVFLNSDWEDNDAERDYGFDPAHLGEVRDAPRVTAWADMPQRAAGLGPCGNPRWFMDGVPVDPERPPTVYTADGLAVCCRPGRGILWGGVPDVPRGGLLWASVDVPPPYCDEYIVAGIALLAHWPGGGPYRWALLSGIIPVQILEAPEHTGIPGTWYYRLPFTSPPSLYENTDDWDGHPEVTFTKVTGPGSPFRFIRCNE